MRRSPLRSFILSLVALTMSLPILAQTTATQAGSDGLWNTAANWTNGVPVAGGIATVNKVMTIDGNISVGANGIYTINSATTDPAGGAAYTLNVSGAGPNIGSFRVFANTVFEGACNINGSGDLVVEPGCTLTLGATTFANNSTVNVKPGGTLIINGTLTNNNNSTGVVIDGLLIVNGSFTGGNGSAITGSGSLSTTGSASTSGSGTIFGSTNDCAAGPCSSANLCGTNSITPTSSSTCSGSAPGTINGSAVAGYSYQWQSATSSAGPWTNLTTLATSNQNYTPGVLTANTFFRRFISNGTCTSYSLGSLISVVTAASVPASSPGSGATCTQITANWAAATNATSYLLDVSTLSDFSSFVVNGLNVGNVLTRNVTGLTAGTTYYYRVRAVNACGTTTNSTSVTYATLPATPLAPVASPGSGATCTQITANWNASTNASSYLLDVSTSMTFGSFVTGYNGLNVGNVTTYNVPGLTVGTIYYYRVRATNTCGTSGNSGGITYATLPATPLAPGSLAGSAAACTQITANWNASANASSYLLDVSTSMTFGSFVSGYNGLNVGNVTTYNVTGLTAGTIYYYRVRATNTCGTSGNSGRITYPTLPATPVAPVASAGSGANCTQITANWATATNATSYLLDVSIASDFSSFVTGYNGLNVGNVLTRNVTGLTAGTTYYYRVRATNTCGTSPNSGTITYATLAVPLITTQPAGQTVCSGSMVSLSVVATGTGLTYQWRKGGVNISGATSATYTIFSTAVGDAGNYDVVVNNSVGCPVTSSVAAVVVNASPVVSQIPTTGLIGNFKLNGNAINDANINQGTLQGGPTPTTDRFGNATGALAFNGSSQFVSTATSYNNIGTFTLSLWFRTTSTVGGKLIGYGQTQVGVSSNYDRHIYMSNSGVLYFGAYPGAVRTVTNGARYNDGEWHMATASLSPANGMRLYVDGVLVATDPSTVSAQNYTGFWKIGFDNTNGWTNAPSSNYFTGSLDDVLIYHSELTATEVNTLYANPDGVTSNSEVCEGGTLNLSATGTAGTTYAWTGVNGFTSTLQNPSVANMSLTTSGVYSATMTATNGCVATVSTIANLSDANPLSQMPTSGLLSYYKFEGNADDFNNVNNGTLPNGATAVNDRFGVATSAYRFNGSSQYATTGVQYNSPNNFTVSIWFNTTTTTGGKLIGFGQSQTGTSGNYDRHLYMTNAGRIVFGVYPGAVRTISSVYAYNDGNWHMATASLSTSGGMKLYIDGVLVASDATVTSGQNYNGYWRIGFDNISGWLTPPSSYYFNGTLDDILIYNRELTTNEIGTLYNSLEGAGNNGPVCIGNPLNLTVTASPGYTYAWSGPNGFTSTLQNPPITATAALSDAGTYNLIATQSATSCVYRLSSTVIVSSPPSITTQPVNRTVCAGASATFSVVATGSFVAYQWRKNGVNISGAISASYTISSTVSGDAGTFDVVVTSGGCSINSTAVTLVVNTAPAITAQPTAQTICVGTPVTFSVTATGTNLTYQWRRGPTPISGATSSSYTIPSPVAGDAGNYSVVISNTGCAAATSNTVSLTVNPATVITAQPTSQTICLGNAVTFSVTATGTSLQYQWRKGGVNISGATSATYNIPSTVTGDQDSYDVVITSTGCTAVTSNTATLTINTTNQWTGAVSTNWFTTSNWSCNVVPNSNLDAVIPAPLARYPVINTGSTGITRNLNINNGATLSMSSNSTLEMYGNWTNAGTFNASTGKVEFKGSAGIQTIDNQSTSRRENFYGFTVDKSAGTVQLNSTTLVNIIAGGTVLVLNGTLDLNSRPFTLKSAPNRTYNDGVRNHSVDSTARLGTVTGSINNASSFAIERYIAAATTKPRMLSTSVTNMPASQWADSVTIFGGDFRALTGFPTTTSTLYRYNESLSFGTLSKGYSAITTKATILAPGQGYRLIVGYDNNPLYTSPAKPAITLKMTGVPQIGNMTTAITKSGADPYGWNMVGNPYPCEISWNSVYSGNSSDLSATVAILDPRASGTSDYYYYNAFTNTAIDPRYSIGSAPSTFASTPRLNAGVIASSQGFFVFKTSAGNGTMSFAESHKVIPSVMTVSNFRTAVAPLPQLNIIAATSAGHLDNTYIFFSDDASATSFDGKYDAYKFNNTNVSIATNTFGKDMAMNGMESKESETNIPLIVTTKAMGDHSLVVQGIETLGADKFVYLVDNYTGVTTELTQANNAYNFTYVSGDSLSTSRSRFVLRVATEERIRVVTNNQSGLEVATMNLFPNPSNGDINITLAEATADSYELQIIDSRGVLVFEEKLSGNATFTLKDMNKYLDAGVYTVRVNSQEKVYIGKLVFVK